MSGGEQQRTAIARALIMKPDFLFADEPTGNLDTASGDKVLDIFHKVNQQGTTLIMVTHDPDYAASASRQLHMVDGRVDQDRVQKKLKD
jgi:putative ABC transport system ATP-binding protein/lipoprotein-releasing system ATP-binding protein